MIEESDNNALLLKNCAYDNLVITLKDALESLRPSDFSVEESRYRIDLAIDIYLKASKQLQLLPKDTQPMY